MAPLPAELFFNRGQGHAGGQTETAIRSACRQKSTIDALSPWRQGQRIDQHCKPFRFQGLGQLQSYESKRL